jgi:hypothetical protein
MPVVYPIWDKLAEEQAASIGGTGIYKLPDKGKVSGLVVYITADSKGINAQEKAKLVETISKMEVIVDGSRELHSYSGQLAQAMAFYDKGLCSIDKIQEYGTGMQRCLIPMAFGRRFADKRLGYTAENYSSGRVHITNDMSSTYWQNLAIKVYMMKMAGEVTDWFDAGVLEKKEYKGVTAAQNTEYDVDLPTQGKMRRILLQAIPNRSSNKDACDFRDIMRELKYTGKSGDILFFDDSLDSLLHWNAFDYGFNLIQHGEAYRAADDCFQWGGGMQLGHGAFSSSADDAVSTVVPTRSRDDDGSVKMEGYEADSPVSYLVKGLGIFHTAVFRHDRMEDLSDLLDLDEYKTCKLWFKTRDSSGVASADVKILNEIVRAK